MLRAAALVFAMPALLAGAACEKKTVLELYVDGFQPSNVRFELEDLGPLDEAGIRSLDQRPDVDGIMMLPPGSCGNALGAGACRVSLLSVFVHNMGHDATSEPAPVVRLRSPTNRAVRLPIPYRGGAIDKGRIGRIRWAVQMWPEETSLTATLSSSVEVIDPPPSPSPPSEQKGPPP